MHQHAMCRSRAGALSGGGRQLPCPSSRAITWPDRTKDARIADEPDSPFDKFHDTANEQEQRIRARAHAMWESERRPDGREDQYWLRAKELIEAESPISLPASSVPGQSELSRYHGGPVAPLSSPTPHTRPGCSRLA
ncbi:DUF2934 domain-containing protein [Micromonospora sp. STR1s_5]|nr:DUF2934 domain-containing protein [Micromonospora sp. STR1s_5]